MSCECWKIFIFSWFCQRVISIIEGILPIYARPQLFCLSVRILFSGLVVDERTKRFEHFSTMKNKLTPKYLKHVHMANGVWDKNTYPFPKVRVSTVGVWEWIRNFTVHLHFTMDAIT